MIGLRAHDHVDRGLAPHDLFAFGLRHAAGDGNAKNSAALLLELTQATEFREDLLGRLLADMACVDDDEFGGLGRINRRIAQRLQDVAHPFGVVDVGLAAVALDVEAFVLGFWRVSAMRLTSSRLRSEGPHKVRGGDR